VRIAALSFSIIALALLTDLVCLFDCRHSAAVFLRLCAEGESFRGSVPIFLISVTHSGLGNDYGQRPGRGIRLEGTRSASTTTKVRAHLGRADSWCYMGLLAPACVPVERDAAKRLVIHPIFCWLCCAQRDRDPVI